ncbi:MAG: xanthine dehydrogenase family protein molybdopterin-binding subunit [Anaerolineae bacterium]|jgi:CO/xanthine dehydrogenase Mo-binding subunit
MNEHRYVGRPADAVDGLAKIRGQARFVGDYQLPGMLHTRVLRSPVPHARIVRLDVTPALAVPGVVAAITCEDFVDHSLWGWPIRDQYILAYRKVLYVGHGMAAVAAETPGAARAGVEAIEWELEDLPAVFDPHKALDPDAPQVPLESPTGQGNLCETIIVRYGEPDPILQACPVRYDETFNTGRQEHAYLEPEAAMAIPQPDGSVTVHYCGQSPFINQSHLMQVLGLPAEKVRVVQPVVGGSFGGKDDLGYQTSGQVAALALKTGRPVKLVLGREESMMASYKREPMAIRFDLGADDEGNLQAARVEMLADSGCFSSMTTLAMLRASLHAAGAYRYRAVHVDTQAVYTNNGFSGAFRGFGNTDAAAAIEQAIDDLAHRLGHDPLDYRLQNCVRQGDRFMSGNVVDHEVKLAECLQWVRERSDWDRKRAAFPQQDGDLRRGLGVACYMHGSSLGGEGADYAHTTLKIESDYRITLTSGLTDYGQGSRTVFTLIAAETLGVDPARIHMLRPDTDTALESGPTVASRSTMLGGNATQVAAEKLDRLLRYAAASSLDCTPAQVARHGEVYVNPDEDEVSFEEAVDRAREMGLLLSVQGKWSMPHIEWHLETGTGTPYYCYTFGAQVAEVEVDTRIGQARVLKVWAAHDGGTIVFPQGAYGQMYGGIAQGLGYGLLEEMNYHQGYPQALNYDEYLIPTSLDVPEIEATYLESDFPEGPYGAKNLAEPVLVATAPAIANAVFHATGVRHYTLPLTLERMLLGHDLRPSRGEQACRRALGHT